MADRKIDERVSYNWLFFLLAIGFALVTAWAFYDELVTRREYKSFQEDFFKLERDLDRAKQDAEKQSLAKNQAYAQLLAEEKAILAELGTQRGEIEKREAELLEATFSAFDKKQDFTFSKSELDEAYYYLTKARHALQVNPKDADRLAEYEERRSTLDALTTRTAAAEKAMNLAQENQAAKQKALDAEKHTERLSTIRKEMEALRRPLEEAERSYQRSSAKLEGVFGVATEIVQQDLADIEKVDRCESCHMGAARGGFETVARPEFRSHPMRRTLLAIHPPEKFGCTTCHDGQGRATTKFFAHAPGPDEDSRAFHEHYWEYPLLKGPKGGDGTEYMESKCLGCHKDEWNLRSELECELDAECPATPDNRAMLCDVPRPKATPGAPHGWVEEALVASSEPAESSRKYCLLPDRKVAKKFLSLDQSAERQRDEIAKLAPEEREKLRNKSAKTLVSLAPNLTRGLMIMEEVGCYGCHPIDGFLQMPKPAPDLTRVAQKLDPAWMVEWIKDPPSFRPNTMMPRFWPELYAGKDSPYPYAIDTPAKRRQQHDEATAMTAFLRAQSRKSTRYTYTLAPLPVPGDAARGALLVATLGCVGCHNLDVNGAKVERKSRASHFDHGPDLSNVGAKTSKEWLYSWVKNPTRYDSAARMPNLRLSDQEAADIAEYLSAQTGDKKLEGTIDLDNADLVNQGRELVKVYGCYGCHQVEGFESMPGNGAELSEFGLKAADRLDFGNLITDHNMQTWDAWLMNKLKHPRAYAYDRATMRMPEFAFTDDEIRAIMVVLKGMRGKEALEVQRLAHVLGAEDHVRERGREIVRLYNCYGCHDVDGFESDLGQLEAYRGEHSKYAPPSLDGQGARTQSDWLFSFLKSPFPMRPLPKVRMPTFGFSDKQANDLVGMFAALEGAQYPFRYYADLAPHDETERRVGEALFKYTGCQKCHLVGDVGGAVPPDVVAPNLVMTKKRLRAEWVSQWLADPNALQRGTAMPAFWLTGNQLETALATSAEAQAVLQGLETQVLEPFLTAKERQIEAVRDFLFVLVPSAPTAAR